MKQRRKTKAKRKILLCDDHHERLFRAQIAQGLTSRVIASELDISVDRVRHVFRGTGAINVIELVTKLLKVPRDKVFNEI